MSYFFTNLLYIFISFKQIFICLPSRCIKFEYSAPLITVEGYELILFSVLSNYQFSIFTLIMNPY